MENKIKVWIARDKDGKLFASSDIPNRKINYWKSVSFNDLELDCTKFPSIKWEDNEPTEAYITLAEPQPKQEKAIDWEQRQYELTKDILIKTYFNKKNKLPLLYDSDIHSAISCAHRIIEKLKNKNK